MAIALDLAPGDELATVPRDLWRSTEPSPDICLNFRDLFALFSTEANQQIQQILRPSGPSGSWFLDFLVTCPVASPVASQLSPSHKVTGLPLKAFIQRLTLGHWLSADVLFLSAFDIAYE